MRWLALAALLWAGGLYPRDGVYAQDGVGRAFTLTPVPDSAQVGDTVRLSFRLVLHERDLLTDTVPRPVGELPAGVRILSVERLRRGADRVFTGEAVATFYRPGPQQVPAFGLPWVQIVTGRRGTVSTEPAAVEIVSVLPGGNPTLRDILDPEVASGPGVLPLALGLLLAAGLGALALRRRARSRPVLEPEPAPSIPQPPPDPYALALSRLERIERERWAETGDVERHFAATADVLRDFLAEAEAIPARERTSTELLWSMPPRLVEGGLRKLTATVLGDADLVKFARHRPDAAGAADHLGEARELLRRWHESADAVR